MRVLLSNDDGLRAPGLRALLEAVMDPDDRFGGALADECMVVAPRVVQSGTSSGITFHEPLMVEEEPLIEDVPSFAVHGRPADCVKLGLSTLFPQTFGEGVQPDLILAGINAGSNCGANVLYSGTVAAAIEGAFLGIPSVAFSQHLGAEEPRFDQAATLARWMLDRLLAFTLPPRECLNVNLPAVDGLKPMPRVRVCPMNLHGRVDQYESRTSPAGGLYYWSAADGLEFHGTDEGSDVDRLLQKAITVTPLRFDMTAHDRLELWGDRLAE